MVSPSQKLRKVVVAVAQSVSPSLGSVPEILTETSIQQDEVKSLYPHSLLAYPNFNLCITIPCCHIRFWNWHLDFCVT